MNVSLQNLTKIFPGRGKNAAGVTAVDDLTFELPDGALVGLLGPSGCGKSTVLNLICGLYKPTRGKILFGGEDVTELPPENRGVGLVFQNYALYPHMSVRQNILFPLENLKGKDKLSKREMLKRAQEAAELVQIDALMDRRPAELSGGQQQRVAIARALVKTPRVLLLDEPLSNLDARLRLQTREEIKRIQRETHVTTVFVTHDQEEAMSVSDIILVMKEGVAQQTDSPQAVYDDPVNLFTAKFLGTPPINVFAGRLSAGRLYIGADCIMDIKNDKAVVSSITDAGYRDRDVYVGIRPEGLIPRPDGCFACAFRGIEVMGRDVSVLAAHESSERPTVRAITGADCIKDIPSGADTVRFDVKPNKCFVFDRDTGARIPLSAGNNNMDAQSSRRAVFAPTDAKPPKED